MKRFALLICACYSFSLCSYAQGRFSLEVSGGSTFILQGGTLLSNWNTGWSMGVGVGYELVSRVQLVITGSYHRLPFRGGLRGIIFPAFTDPNSQVIGNSSEIFETSIALRALSSGKYLQPFVSFQSGIYVMKIGQIFVFRNDLFPPVWGQPLSGTGVTVARGFASIGLGLNVPANENVAIRIECIYSRTHDGGNVFIPIVSSVSFGL